MFRPLLWLSSGRCITKDILQKTLNHTFVHWFKNFSLVHGHGLFNIEASNLEDPHAKRTLRCFYMLVTVRVNAIYF